MQVRDLMQTEVLTLSIDDDLSVADDLMRLGRVRHLPVVNGGRPVGVVSQRDLFRAGISTLLDSDVGERERFLARVAVREVMHLDVETIAPDHGVEVAVGILLEEKIGCLPVVEDDRIVGLISETDLLAYLAHLLGSHERRRALPELRA